MRAIKLLKITLPLVSSQTLIFNEMVTLFLEQLKLKQNLIVLIHKNTPAVIENTKPWS